MFIMDEQTKQCSSRSGLLEYNILTSLIWFQSCRRLHIHLENVSNFQEKETERSRKTMDGLTIASDSCHGQLPLCKTHSCSWQVGSYWSVESGLDVFSLSFVIMFFQTVNPQPYCIIHGSVRHMPVYWKLTCLQYDSMPRTKAYQSFLENNTPNMDDRPDKCILWTSSQETSAEMFDYLNDLFAYMNGFEFDASEDHYVPVMIVKNMPKQRPLNVLMLLNDNK